MGGILLLACAAAVFPLLIASVAILISRPRPRRLLAAFYAGGMAASLTFGVIVLALFDNKDSAVGSTQSSPAPGVSIIGGLVAIFLAWLMVTPGGHRLITRIHERRARRRPPKPKKPGDPDKPSWVEQRLDGSLATIFIVGAALNLPGPYYLIALGEMAEGGYSTVAKALLILAFNLIMFLLLEVPLIGYAFSPDRTAAAVEATRRWLTANGLRITGYLVGVYGLALVIQGIAAAV